MTSIKTAETEFQCPALKLRADTGSEFWARAHAVDVLRAWQLEHLTGLVDPLVAEMVLNGVRHSSTHIAVILRTAGSYLVIDVWDDAVCSSLVLAPVDYVRDELSLTKALADRFDIVSAARGGRLVRAWIARNACPELLPLERRLGAVRGRNTSLLLHDEQPAGAMVTGVVEGLRALGGAACGSGAFAEDGRWRPVRDGGRP